MQRHWPLGHRLAKEDACKFIFTKEGRTLLVSQTGGIKFAILGYVLVGGLASLVANKQAQNAICPNGLQKDWETIESMAKAKDMSPMEYLLESENVTLFMRGVNYELSADPEGTAGTYQIKPASMTAYKEAAANYKDHLYGAFYVPSTELMTDPHGHRYGTYAFNFDRTYLNCDITNDISIRHVLLIGKQYAENKEATFNVNQRQDASIVGIAEIIQETATEGDNIGPGIELLAKQNEFVKDKIHRRRGR